jgi:AcrR family transcriptional regulator
VSPRRYTLGRREATKLATRRRILETAERILVERGAQGTSIDAVADSADVARATVYHQFGSKRGLLEALVQDVQRRAGIDDLATYFTSDAPTAEMIRAVIPRHCAYWAAERDLFRLFSGWAAADPELRAVVERQEERWREGVAEVARRLSREGALQTGVGVKRATSVLNMLLGFETFDRLNGAGGLSVRATGETIVLLAGTVVDFG